MPKANPHDSSFICSFNKRSLTAHYVPCAILDTIDQNRQESLTLWSFPLKQVLPFSPFHRVAD